MALSFHSRERPFETLRVSFLPTSQLATFFRAARK
jgi:hypothetical protein